MEYWFSEYHTKDVKLSIRANEQLFSGKSDYQTFDVFSTPEFGKMLVSDGEIVFTGKKNDFVKSYLFVTAQNASPALEKEYISFKELDGRTEGLIEVGKRELFASSGAELREPDLEQIMVYIERSKNHESFTL